MGREFSNNELSFALKSLKEGLRLDSRDESAYRKISVITGPVYGHSEARIGKTKVLADVKQEIVVPSSKRPQEGVVKFRVDIPSAPFPGLDDYRVSETATLLSRLLNKAIVQSRCIDLESLCITPGEKVLALNVTVSVIDQDGNVNDCSCLAVMAALLSFRYPQITVEGSVIKLYEEDEKPYIPLTVYSTPLLITFAILDDNICLIDPTNLEELTTDNQMTFTVAQDRRLWQILKPGKASVDPEALYRCSQMAITRYTELCGILKKSLEGIADLNLS